MKRINILSIITIISLGLFTNAVAQRRIIGGRSDENNRQANTTQPRMERSPERTFNSSARVQSTNNNNSSVRADAGNSNRLNSVRERVNSVRENNSTGLSGSPSRNDRLISTNNNVNVSRNNPQNSFSRDNITRSNTERNQQVAIEPERNNSTSRVFTPSTGGRSQSRNYDRNPARENNNYRNNNNNNRNNNNNYRTSNYRSGNYPINNYYYRSGYDRRIYMMGGPRYSYRPYNSVSVYFGGYPYYYSDGLFYDYYSGYYQPIYPPFGIRISTLPFGYSRIYMGLNPFYYYNGVFYRNYEDNYEVIDAPMGATVSSLPRGAKSVVINGEKFYELNGTYFKEDRNSKGKIIYVVVGKNGEINNSYDDNDNSSLGVPQLNLQNGDIVPQLPEGSKVITLNGEKLYVAPDDTYLKEEIDGDAVQYRVVGK
ncbi:MAG: DUF6515 family protein [Ginsengibacter sp.]